MPGDIDEDSPGGRGGRLLRLVGLFLLLLAVCAPVVTLHVDRHHPLFVVDEFAYADYLHQIDEGDLVVRHGELSSDAGLRELACRGFEPSTWNDRPPCDAPSYDPAVFPNAGISSADIHPPTYFVITYAGARVVRALGATDDLVDAGRLFGAVWMAAGLLALWCLLRAMGAGRWASASGLPLVAAGPMILRQWHYLTPDAANVLVGSLVMLAVVRWERSGRRRLALAGLAGAGAMAMALKAPNLVVVVAAGLYLLYRAFRGEPEARQSYLRAFGALVGGAAVVSATWVVVRAALSLPGVTPLEQAERVDSLHPSQVIENVARFITPLDREPSSLYPLALLTSYLLMGYLLVALVSLARSDQRYGLALATGTVLIAGPLLLVAVNIVLRSSYAIIEPRYGTTLLPIQAAIAATFWTGRALWAVGALAVIAPLAVLVRLVV
jgi:hypothetical protein